MFFPPLKVTGCRDRYWKSATNIVEACKKGEIQTEYTVTSFLKSYFIVLLHIWIINQALHSPQTIFTSTMCS